jgi:hypothetical protein
VHSLMAPPLALVVLQGCGWQTLQSVASRAYDLLGKCLGVTGRMGLPGTRQELMMLSWFGLNRRRIEGMLRANQLFGSAGNGTLPALG